MVRPTIKAIEGAESEAPQRGCPGHAAPGWRDVWGRPARRGDRLVAGGEDDGRATAGLFLWNMYIFSNDFYNFDGLLISFACFLDVNRVLWISVFLFFLQHLQKNKGKHMGNSSSGFVQKMVTFVTSFTEQLDLDYTPL